jgi:hypothetical protein
MKKNVTISFLLICINTFCFSQTSFYSEGIGFEYNKKWSFSQTKDKEKDITYIFYSNITITKIKVKKDIQIEVDRFVEKWADEMEEYCYEKMLKIKQKSEITDRTIGAAGIETKSIDFEFGKKEVARLYAFSKEEYLITIKITGIINSDINMILNSFWFMPER